jgi:predicted dehydrogenase
MRFLIIGLGSMGKRRIRNLLALGESDIVAFDPRADRRQEGMELYGITTCESFEEGMEKNPDALVISTPPDLHTQFAMNAAKEGKHFFTEASVLDDGLEALDNESHKRGIVAAPSCTMRFHPAIIKAREVLQGGEVGQVLAFTHHFGEYLPRWHPWESYKEFYVSKRNTGACREIVPFELIWLAWLCGKVEAVSCFRGQVGDLEVDIDDIYQVVLQFQSGCLGHLQVDVLQRVGYRQSRFICSEGVISWDWDARKLLVYGSDESWKDYPDTFTKNSTEGFYIDEMAAFLAAIRGEKDWPYPLSEDREILKILRSCEASSDGGKHVKLDDFSE